MTMVYVLRVNTIKKEKEINWKEREKKLRETLNKYGK